MDPLGLGPIGAAGRAPRPRGAVPPLGVASGQGCESSSVELEKGDILLFYTDGISELANLEGKRLGTDGLSRLLLKEASRGGADILKNLYDEASDFCGEISFSDDVLLLSVSRAER